MNTNTLKLDKVFKKSAFLAMLEDSLKDGYTKFTFSEDNSHFVVTNQNNRNADCSFRCDSCIILKENLIENLIADIKQRNKKFILINNIEQNSNVIFT